MAHIIPSPCILHCQTIVQILHHFTLTVNNIEVTVNMHFARVQMCSQYDSNKGPIRWDI